MSCSALPSVDAQGWLKPDHCDTPLPREWSSQWDKQTTCDSIGDAKSCKAKEAQFNCFWNEDLNFCRSYAWYKCGKDTASMACKIDAAANASEKACAKFTAKSVCNAEDACQWSSSKSSCFNSFIGMLLVYKQLGSKIATAFIAQQKTCTNFGKMKACLAAPPRQSATTSYAKGKGCDWYGGNDDPCIIGTEFGNLLYASADNDIDR